jgi:hypothetical protein
MRGRLRYRNVIALALSIGLVYAGFFVGAVPFAVAVLPFVAALCFRKPKYRGLAVAPYFMAIALIAGWGLIQMGHVPWQVILAGLTLSALCSAMVGYFGVTIACLVLSVVPFFPGHPLLAAGFLFPNGTVWFLIILICAFGVIEGLASKRQYSTVSAILMLVLGFASLGMQSFSPGPLSQRELATAQQWEKITTNSRSMVTKRGQMVAIMTELEDGETYITGENILTSQDRLETQMWCRVVSSNNATVYLGIQEAQTGRSQVHVLRADADCDQLPLAYSAQVAIPGITGNFWPFDAGFSSPDNTLPDTQWLACFEGFSLISWIRVGLARPANVIIISNDYWTEPLPISELRRKISSSMGRLFGVRVYHADSGHNILHLTEQAFN